MDNERLSTTSVEDSSASAEVVSAELIDEINSIPQRGSVDVAPSLESGTFLKPIKGIGPYTEIGAEAIAVRRELETMFTAEQLHELDNPVEYLISGETSKSGRTADRTERIGDKN